MMSRGIVSRENDGLRINPRFRKLADFIQEAQDYNNSRLASQISPDAVIVWSQGSKFIIRVPHEAGITDKRFQQTATTRLADYGIPLMTNHDYYVFMRNPRRLRTEDILLHMLLVDGVSKTTYALILMRKTRIDNEYLARRAQEYQLRDKVEAMLRFLDTHEAQPGMLLPTWEEFAEKAGIYGVNP
jgi:hypothetical protein